MDTLTAAMTFTWSNGQSEELELIFEETGETTGHFTASAWRPIDGPALGGLLNLVLPESFDSEESDTVYTYMGDRDAGAQDDFPMDEAGTGLRCRTMSESLTNDRARSFA